MNNTTNLVSALALATATLAFMNPVFASAAKGSIDIMSPKNHAVLSSGSGDKLEYKVQLSPNGNHLHIYIDKRRPLIDRQVSNCPCTIDLPKLSPGKHWIKVEEATKRHALTGVKSTIVVRVKS